VIRVLVAEDSAVTREYLVYLLSQDPALEVIGVARDGLEAVQQAERLRPDVIVMDVHMPRMDGYEATRRIMEGVPTPIVIVSASSSRQEVAATLDALKAGALTVLDKPAGPDHPAHEESARRLVETVKLMAEVKVVRRWPKRDSPERPAPAAASVGRKIQLVAIAASTGGPPVVAEILRRLPGDLAAPVLLVQHIAPGFTEGLVEWLARETPLAVKLAAAGESAASGTVYIAPDGFQMGITTRGQIRLVKEPTGNGFCPSASHLFESVAEAYGPTAIGVLLTGMGRDGADGLLRLRRAGGVTIAQDEQSSAVFGMPAEAIRLGAAASVLAPEDIARAIHSLVSGGRWHV
jgi:two-component system chemotaxis response regulator CheB